MNAPNETTLPILLREDSAGVARLTLNRPGQFNSLSEELSTASGTGAGSPGEIDAIARAIPWDRLLDESSPEWCDNRLDRMLMEPKEKLLRHPGILRTPVVRLGRDAAAGHDPVRWQAMADAAKGG